MRLGTLRQFAAKTFGRLGQTSGILMYHRVAQEAHDPWDLCVTPAHFSQQMSLLRNATRCVSLSAFGAQRLSRRSSKLRLAVTFDDGYRDNIVSALPILEQFDIPATIFIVSGSIGSSREFWWDTLERCILQPQKLPLQLELEINGVVRSWNLDAQDEGGTGSGWSADRDDSTTPRQRAFLELWNLLSPLDGESRERSLNALMTWASVDFTPSEDRLPMSLPELIQLGKHPLIEIGCHTADHLPLPKLPVSEQRRQIESGRNALEEWLERPIKTFSYPYGLYNQSTLAIVRNLSFQLACTSRPAAVTPLDGRWSLPRLQVINQDGDGFGQWLQECFPLFSRRVA